MPGCSEHRSMHIGLWATSCIIRLCVPRSGQVASSTHGRHLHGACTGSLAREQSYMNYRTNCNVTLYPLSPRTSQADMNARPEHAEA